MRVMLSCLNRLLALLFGYRVARIYRSRMRKAERSLGSSQREVTKEERDRYTAYWRAFGLNADPVCCSYYSKIAGVFDVRYVPNDIFYCRIERVLNNPNDAFHYANKNLLDLSFDRRAFPQTYLRHFASAFFDGNYREVSRNEALAILRSLQGSYVQKLSEESCGGHGVTFHQNSSVKAAHKDGTSIEESVLSERRAYLIQGRITQSEFTAQFHPASVNTFRVVTLRRPASGEAVVLKRILRMGVGGSEVDNQSSGGISVGVFDSGALNTIAFDGQGGRYDAHPSSSVKFAGQRLHEVESLDAFALSFAKHTPSLRLLALDIAQCSNGGFKCLEVNTYGMQIDFLQTFEGGLFGQHTDEVLEFCTDPKNMTPFRHVRGFYF